MAGVVQRLEAAVLIETLEQVEIEFVARDRARDVRRPPLDTAGVRRDDGDPAGWPARDGNPVVAILGLARGEFCEVPVLIQWPCCLER